MIPKLLSTRKNQQGFSLLEVLVSIVILTFGILGAVGLQATSLQASREARLQSNAVRLADEIAELMRANHQSAIKTDAAQNPYLIDIAAASSTEDAITCGLPQSASTPCSGTGIGTRDIRDWLSRLNAELPGSRAVICFDNTPYDTSGLPQWNCSNTGNSLAIKIGWTRANTLQGATGSDATNTSTGNLGAFDKALRPAVIIPVTPGVS